MTSTPPVSVVVGTGLIGASIGCALTALTPGTRGANAASGVAQAGYAQLPLSFEANEGQAARDVRFRRVLQYQTLDAFNTDYHGLELSMVKRMANRWSARASYSLSRGRDVNVYAGVERVS